MNRRGPIRLGMGGALAAAVVVLALAAATAPAERDDVAMDRYVFGLLRRGPAWTPEHTPRTDSIQSGHMANIDRMASAGALLAAGPLLDGGDLRGVFVFRADSLHRLQALVRRDPAIESQRLVLDLYAWSAPAGIGGPYRAMSKRPGFRDSMVRYQLGLLKMGPRRDPIPENELHALRHEHAANVTRLLRSGAVLLAGPISGGGDLQAILVFRGDSAEAARHAVTDPEVRAGWTHVELHPWFAAYGTMPADTLAP